MNTASLHTEEPNKNGAPVSLPPPAAKPPAITPVCWEAMQEDAPDPDRYDSRPGSKYARAAPGIAGTVPATISTTTPIVPQSKSTDGKERKKRIRAPGEMRKPAGESKGRFQTINAFLDTQTNKLTSTESLIWLQLWRSEKDGVVEHQSQEWLAKKLDKHEDTIGVALRRLEKLGYLTVVKTGKFRGGANAYKLHASPVK